MSSKRTNRHSTSTSLPFELLLAAALLLTSAQSYAGPWLMPGDLWLKADVQLLSDSGIITSPISSWPLSWGDIAQDINAFSSEKPLSPAAQAALLRLKSRAQQELGVGELAVDFGVRLAEKPKVIRGFADSARCEQEVWSSAECTGERFALRASGRFVKNDAFDENEGRLDGSYAAVAVGNWMVGASLIDRWWGPGWNGSLILSSSARPIPSLVIERNFSTPFESKWLSWIGPWSTSVIWGQLESNRAIPNARFFGWRVNFRPIPSLEIGLLRTAQWCGSGRDCDLDAFGKVLVGDSNLDVGVENDVANQLAGFDFRWLLPIGQRRIASYAQFIGEDEAGGFPSKFLGQLGLETWGYFSKRGLSWRGYLEFADSTCQFNENSRIFDCAYNNSFYPTGYRFRGRPIGYTTDNDARSVVLGFVAHDVEWGEFSLTVRHMKLNRGGFPDPRNVISQVPNDVIDADLVHRRSYDFFDLELGLGVERADNSLLGKSTDLRAFAALTVRL